MKITNKFNVPEPLVTLASKEYYTKGAAQYSVTELISPPKVRRLRERHNDEIEQDVSDMLWQLLGSALHVVMERGDTDGWTKEERLYAKINGVTLSGQIDLQQQTNGGIVIWDYKFTSAWAVMNDKIEWEQQLNIYKWLVEQRGQKVAGLRICAFIRDFNRHETKEAYPKAPIHVMEFPMWDSQQAQSYIEERLELHRDAKVNSDLGEEFVDCTPEERWMSDTIYAVRREGRKTAIRVFKTIEEATELAEKEKGYVETRLGEPRRCVGDYCGVSRWCKQHQLWKAGFHESN